MQRHSLSGTTMGTRYSAVFFAAAGVDEAAIAADLFAAVNSVDQQMSSWKPESELSRLNRAPAGQWQVVPKALYCVLLTALRVGEQSRGAFDIGVGDLVDAWGFGAGQQQPDEQQIRRLQQRVYRAATDLLEIDHAHNRVRKRAPVSLDLSGIAKGYGVDALAHCLDGLGIRSYLVGIDGEMRAGNLKPDGRAWAIAIEKPLRGVREAMSVMEIRDCAIATSGDYRRWTEIEGKHYAHTMNPLLGRPSCNRLAAVTVLESSCMLADAWASALLVLGEDEGVELAQERGMDALFVLHEGQRLGQISIAQGKRQACAIGTAVTGPGIRFQASQAGIQSPRP